jgi:hypothetical protein
MTINQDLDKKTWQQEVPTKQEILDWLGVDQNFKKQFHFEPSNLNKLLTLVYPQTDDYLWDAFDTTVKLKVFLTSEYYDQHPMGYKETLLIFNPIELAYILTEYQELFKNYRPYYITGYRSSEVVFEEVMITISESLEDNLKLVDWIDEIGGLKTLTAQYNEILRGKSTIILN